MEKITTENISDIWNRLSLDAKILSIYLSRMGDLSLSKETLTSFSKKDNTLFDLDKGLDELSASGVLRQITLIQEKRERLIHMPKPRDIMFMNIEIVPDILLSERLSNKTEAEKEYFNLADEISQYEKYKNKYPKRYQGWEEPRFKLNSEFQEFIKVKLHPR
jgi:hypothetical protein